MNDFIPHFRMDVVTYPCSVSFSTKPLSQPILCIVNWTVRNKHKWNFNQNRTIFIQENAFENIVCKLAAILSQPQRGNSMGGSFLVLIEIQPGQCHRQSRARFLSLAGSKLRLWSTNHRPGYFSNLACDWLSIVYDQPITGKVTSVTWPVIGWA